MSDPETRAALAALYLRVFGVEPEEIVPIRSDGSNRKILRLRSGGRSVVGVRGGNRAENDAFIGFSRHFRSVGLPVPEIIAEDAGEGLYLETDLGDETLHRRLLAVRREGRFPGGILPIYEETVRALVRFQIDGHRGLDYGLCHQGGEFGAAAMRRDIDYFREHFLGLLYRGPLDGKALDRDFDRLVAELDGEDRDYFLYRDFQARNVMILDDRPWFIDYQSGRRGPLAYDLASLLYSARADLGEEVRARLTETYLEELAGRIPVDRERFLRLFPGFVLIRILQALGAYGNLGIRQEKTRFLDSVPFAIANLRALLARDGPLARPGALRDLVSRITEDPDAVRVPER
ncbi:MAG: phosphotransferase [Candidatus Eisenbacteria bacterium]|nr:phosphotransferase [Candidatus Eisenbacteria bacterium]